MAVFDPPDRPPDTPRAPPGRPPGRPPGAPPGRPPGAPGIRPGGPKSAHFFGYLITLPVGTDFAPRFFRPPGRKPGLGRDLGRRGELWARGRVGSKGGMAVPAPGMLTRAVADPVTRVGMAGGMLRGPDPNAVYADE